MKRIAGALVIAGLSLAAGLAVAQETGLVAKGLKAGVGSYQFSGDDKVLDGHWPHPRTGLAGGAFATFALGSAVALQPELLYVTKGANYKEGDEKYTFKLDYLELPLLLKYRFPTSCSLRPSLFAGPAVSFKLSARGVHEGNGEETEEDLDNCQDWDVGVAVGGGLDFAAAGSTITFDVRYTIGLRSWWKTDNTLDDEDSRKNGGWLAALGYAF